MKPEVSCAVVQQTLMTQQQCNHVDDVAAMHSNLAAVTKQHLIWVTW
jgi:hypothetical protein